MPYLKHNPSNEGQAPGVETQGQLARKVRYAVNVGRRNRYYDSLEDAKRVCQAVFEQTRIVLSIVEVTRG